MPAFLSRLLRPFSQQTRSLTAPAEGSVPANASSAVFAAGCFWGVEHAFRQRFGSGRGLIDAKVGYCGGASKSPSYRAVCSGSTGHAEALKVEFDPAVVGYRELVEFFFKMHDPTTKDAQGPDRGSQYRSAIFVKGEEQKAAAEDVKARVNKEWWKERVATTVEELSEWYDAEKYHQLYLDKNPSGYECPSHYVRKFPELSKD
ncbi:MAG: Peptide-methionine (S)-S-oxide reductase [Vezdaea aestivalis]|nr:MAG: Peptide-methionine (S)-S-oxide reductase [Vezdaea aestivalis]